ncbi:SH3 domain-containing protein [Treponema sp.]|uniref:SH3 domain-containing protein n=1 Tax=Treponema sp. TaxID=166 RepID=UPI00257F3A65|nr:SH3 domain-containing protein [Treponema sp.]
MKIEENLYEIEGIAKGDYDELEYDFDCFRWSSILKNTFDNEVEKFYIKIDGDYLSISKLNQDNLIITLVYVDNSTMTELDNLFRNKKRNLSKVIWPRYADGSCDYDESKKTTVATQTQKTTSSTNVSKNKLMTVRENLKLRSGEATSTQVLTVMSAGTKVKILELGKTETIDSISSNWVKVEVQKGAKDREGKPIKQGTVGWCYGGYLE